MERESERERKDLLVYYLDNHRLKPGARCFIWVSFMSDMLKHLDHLLLFFLGHQQRWEMEQLDTNQSSYSGITGDGVTC